jgi:hypothetical protein
MVPMGGRLAREAGGAVHAPCRAARQRDVQGVTTPLTPTGLTSTSTRSTPLSSSTPLSGSTPPSSSIPPSGIATRVGAVPTRSSTTLSEWLVRCELALEAGADGLFIPDHTKVRDRFGGAHLSCAVALGAARARFGDVALGPLIGRVGGGMDEHVLSMLDTIVDGEVVACLGIGDRNARFEHEVSGLTWDSVEVRWERLCRTAERCMERGFETWAATDRVDLAQLLPDGVGVHVQHAIGETFGGRSTAFSAFGALDGETLARVAECGYRWVCVAQLQHETDEAFSARLAGVRRAVSR